MTTASEWTLLIKVFAGLIFLTIVTVLVAFIDLGIMNFPAAMIIAGLKASLVGSYFMHTRKAQFLVKLFAGGALIWVGILIGLTFNDYYSRPWVTQESFWETFHFPQDH